MASACTRDSVTVERVRMRSGSETACVYIERHPCAQDGRDPFTLSIRSSFGSWMFTWSHPGPNARRFIAGLDRGYACGKLVGYDEQFSPEDTAQLVREHILEDRRGRGMSADAAREEWELADSLEAGELSFEQWLDRTSFDDAHEFYSTGPGPRARDFHRFYELFWPMLTEEMLRAAGE